MRLGKDLNVPPQGQLKAAILDDLRSSAVRRNVNPVTKAQKADVARRAVVTGVATERSGVVTPNSDISRSEPVPPLHETNPGLGAAELM